MSPFARKLQTSVSKGSVLPGAFLHGQEANQANTGRAGAAAAGTVNYSATLATLTGARTYSTTQTIRNTRFTGQVFVTGGSVTFEYCSFEVAPPAAAAQLRQYNDGSPSGTVVCNWCDFDTGLRGNQGNFETTCAQFGERGGANPPTVGSSFTLYRCRLRGAGNLIGAHQWRSSSSSVVECYVADATVGGSSHPDGIEIYSSDNITLLRSRFEIDTTYGQSCINITTDFGDVPSGNPIIVQDCYINGGTSPVLTRWYGQGSGTYVRNVRYMGNYFGDSSYWGRECDFNSMNVTYDEVYALTNPDVIYWATSNVWAPDSENVANPALAPSGDVPAGRPHLPGGFVSASNFYGGEVWTWSGSVLP